MFPTTMLAGCVVIVVSCCMGVPCYAQPAPKEPAQAPGITLYVAANGNDLWSGTAAEPNLSASDGPFATLHRARDAVRALRTSESGKSAPVTVMIRGGVFFLEETLVLEASDGGTREAPVVWRAYPGEKPVLSGGFVLDGWTEYKDAILRAELPEAREGKVQTRQLFYRGQRQRRARWPKFDASNPLRGGWAFPEGSVPNYGMRAVRFKPDAFPRRWAKPHEGEVNIFVGHGWCNNIVPIREIDYDKRIIWLARATMNLDCPPWFTGIPLGSGSRFFVENILEELSAPGEWCISASEGACYFWPPEGAPAGGDVVIPRLDCLVRIENTQWITLSGITFTQTTTGDDYHRSRLEGYGAMFPQQGWAYCGEALYLRGAAHCTIEECLFDQVGGNAIYLERENRRNVIRRNEIAYAGANAVVLIGDRAFHPMFNEVEDNHIHHAGALINYVAGVFLGVSDGNVIAHNSIHDMPHHAINLGSNGIGRNYVEYNEIRRVCLEIADTGAINSWMDVPGPWIEEYAERSGHVIRNNLIVDVPGAVVENSEVVDDITTRGIYLDDCTSNCLVSGNVIIRAGMGFPIHGGKHNIVENNIVLECRMGLFACDYPPLRRGNEKIKGMFRGNRFARNIVSTSHPNARAYLFHAWTGDVLAYCDENLLHFVAPKALRVDWEAHPGGLDRSTFDEWRAMGFDRYSLTEDPKFVDPAAEDVRLQPDSPALKLGFRPIDISNVGIRNNGAKTE